MRALVFSLFFFYPLTDKLSSTPFFQQKCNVTRVVFEDNKRLDSSILKEIYFNEDKQPIKEIGYFENKQINYEKIINYKEGRVTKEIYKTIGLPKEEVIYTYNLQGQVIKKKELVDQKISIVTEYNYVSNKLKSKYTYENKNNKLIIVSKEIWVYDLSSKLIKEIVINGGSDTSNYTVYSYVKDKIIDKSYDANGRLIQHSESKVNSKGLLLEKVFVDNDTIKEREVYTYNLNGDTQDIKRVNNKDQLLYFEHHEYYSNGLKKKISKSDLKKAFREEIQFNENQQVLLEEQWFNDGTSIKLYYNYNED